MEAGAEVLIVDDDEVDRMALQRTLQAIDPTLQIAEAEDGASALAQLQQHPFACALIDYRLPDIDGIALLQQLQQQQITTPVVMLTGHGDELLAVAALQAGAVDYLPKLALNRQRLWRSLHLVDRLRQSDQQRDTVQQQLLERERALRHMAHAINHAAESVMITDRGGIIEYVNPAFSLLTGYHANEALRHTPNLLKSGRQSRDFYHDLWQVISNGQVWRGELINRRKDGSLFDSAVTIAPVHSEQGEHEGYIATHRDITEEKRLALELRRLAHTDELTGLYNRRYLMARLDEELARVRRYLRPFCLLLIDLDLFKRVNDSYGHLKGDEVLVTSARMLREVVRGTDLVGRYGGEEFCVVLPETGLLKARRLAERIRERFAEQRYYDGEEQFQVTCSIGLAQASVAISSREQILQWADEALYRAKAAGRNRVEVAL